MPRTRLTLVVAAALLAGPALAPSTAHADTLHALCSRNVPLPWAMADPTGMTDVELSRRGVAVCLIY